MGKEELEGTLHDAEGRWEEDEEEEAEEQNCVTGLVKSTELMSGNEGQRINKKRVLQTHLRDF